MTKNQGPAGPLEVVLALPSDADQPMYVTGVHWKNFDDAEEALAAMLKAKAGIVGLSDDPTTGAWGLIPVPMDNIVCVMWYNTNALALGMQRNKLAEVWLKPYDFEPPFYGHAVITGWEMITNRPRALDWRLMKGLRDNGLHIGDIPLHDLLEVMAENAAEREEESSD